MQQMQVHLCTFYRQEELANRRTRPAPRRGLPDAYATSAGCLAGGSYSSHSSRSSVRGIPGSAAVLCRSSNAARATTDAKRAALLKRICSQQIAARCICPGQLMPCRRFRNPLLCSTAARQSATTTRAAAALRRSHWSAPGCRKMRGGDARTHNDRESTMPLASNAADRTSSTVARRRRRLGPSKNPRSDGARLWNRPYTLWRADRPAICGGNAVLH